MNKPVVDDALEYCLVALERGQNLESCLGLYPELAKELRPVLEAAQAARSLSNSYVPNAAYQRSRARVLKRAAQLRASRPAAPGFWRWLEQAAGVFTRNRSETRSLGIGLAALLLALVFWLSWRGLVVTSAQALPGDALYPVKRAAEGVTLNLTPNREARHRIEARYNRLRIEEVKGLLALERAEMITFEGVLTEIGAEALNVEGLRVVLTPSTREIGDLQPGRFVEVEGLTDPPGQIIAHEIHLRYFEISGSVEAIEKDRWTISGTQLALLSDTQIDPGVKAGDQVLVLVYSDDSGKLAARAIVRLPAAQPAFKPFEIEFTGTVEAIDAVQIQVNGKTLTLTTATKIEGKLALGAPVIVQALVAADGSLTALRIEQLASQPADIGDPTGGGSEPDPGSPEPEETSPKDDGSGSEGSGSDDSSAGSEDSSGSEGSGSDDGSAGSEDSSGSEGSGSDEDSGGSEDSGSGPGSGSDDAGGDEDGSDKDGSGGGDEGGDEDGDKDSGGGKDRGGDEGGDGLGDT